MTVLKQAASVRQNANQGPPRRRWRSRFARIGVGLFTLLSLKGVMNIPRLRVPIVAQFFAVFVLSLFTYVASAGDDCTYTPTSWDWENKYQYHYGLKADSTWINTPTAHITVQIESGTFNENGSVKIVINGNPVTLFTDSDLHNEVPLPSYPNNPTPNDHYNFDYRAGDGSIEFWFYTGFIEKSTTIQLKHWVANVGSWDDITWTLNVSCPEPLEQLSKPNLSSPSDGVSDISTTSQDFDWGNVTGANTYRIVVSKYHALNGFTDKGAESSCNSNCKTHKTGSSDHNGFNLEADTEYCWSVRAGVLINSGLPEAQASEWSTRCFTTEDDSVVPPPVVPPPVVTITILKPSSAEKGIVGFRYIPVGKNTYEVLGCESCSTIKTEKGNKVIIDALGKGEVEFDSWHSQTSCFDDTTISTRFTEFRADEDCNIKANFKKKPDDDIIPCDKNGCKLTVDLLGDGNGTVTSNITGINCEKNGGNSSCSSIYEETKPATTVKLTAKPSDLDGSDFGSWGGDCEGETTNICEVEMDSDRLVNITFVVDPNEVKILEKVDELQEKVNAQEEENKKLNENIDVLKGELKDAKAKIKRIQETLTQDIADKKRELDKVNKEVKELEKKLKKAKTESEEKSKKIRELEEEVKKIKAEAEKTEIELKKKIDKLDEEVKQAKKDSEEQKKALTKIDEDLKKVEKELTVAKAKIEKLELKERIRDALFEKTPTPSDDSENVEVDVNLSWTSAVADEVTLTYQVYFGTNDLAPLTSCKAKSLESCVLDGDLPYGTRHYWQLEVLYNGDTIRGPKWSFKTRANKAPYPPIKLSLCDKDENGKNIEIEAKDWQDGVTLTWELPKAADYRNKPEYPMYEGVNCDVAPDNPDCENDPVTYWIYFDDLRADPIASTICADAINNVCSIFIPANKLELKYGKKYDWHVFPTDKENGKDDSARNNVEKTCTFETRKNLAPYVPESPSLKNGDTQIKSLPFDNIDQTLPITITWKAGDLADKGDPDVGDIVTYSVELTGCTATVCEVDQMSCTIPIGTLTTDETCWLQVTAKDNNEDSNDEVGKLWSFTTQANKPPNKASNPVLIQGGVELSSDSEVDPKADLTFGWTDNGDPDPEDVNLSYKVCYVNKAEMDMEKKEVNLEEQAACLSDYSSTNPQILPASWKKLRVGATYTWIVSVKDEHGNKSEWDVWTFNTKPASPTIDLTANSGHANTLLVWEAFNKDLFNIVGYRILRIQGNDPELFKDDTKYTVVKDFTDDSVYEDDEQLEKEKQYCYQVDGLDVDGNVVTTSSFSREKTCVIFGETLLQVIGATGQKGGPSQPVPIEMPNGGDLVITSGNICLGFDGNVLEVDRVESTAFSGGDYFFTPSNPPIEISGISDITHFVKITVGNNIFDPEAEFPTLNELMGAGSLAEVYFKVKENATVDFSQLKLLHNKNGEFDKTSAVDCSNLYAPNNTESIPLTVRNGTFTVTTRRDSRDSNGNRQALFHVRNAYIRGDLNGNGIVDAADARIADGIGITKGKIKGYELTPERRMAGDINRDQNVNSADAGLIVEYGFTHVWNSDKFPLEGDKTSTRSRTPRDGNQNTTVLLSMDDVSGMSGSEVIATLSIDNVDNLYAMNTTVAYDKNVIEKIVRVQAIGLATGAGMPYYDNKDGILRIGMHSKTSIDGSGEIATITLRLASGGKVRSTPLAIAKTNLYDVHARDFTTSILQRNIDRRNGSVIITDVEEHVVVDGTVMTLIGDIMPDPSSVVLYGAYGRVIDKNGTPMAGITITVGDKTDVTDNAGSYAIVALTEGNYSVTANKASDDSFIAMEKMCVVGDNENCQVDFVVDTGKDAFIDKYALYGTVVDIDGFPIQGATVKTGDYTTVTDKTGFFVFLDLVAGEYRVTARKDTEALGEGTCLVGGDSNCKLDFNTHFDQNPPEPEAAFALCQLYAVHDEGLNNSQFITVSLDGLYTVNLLGPMYYGYDFESIAIDPKTDIIYTVPGDKVVDKSLKGVLHIVDGENGDIFPVGSTGFNEIEDLTFSKDGTLWAWAKGDGLITIDPITGVGTLQIASDLPVEGLTVCENEEGGLIFYGAYGTILFVYDWDANTLDTDCRLPGKTEALEIMPNCQQLVIGIDNDNSLGLHLFDPDPEICKVVANADIPTTKNDIEGIALPIKACVKESP
jgi:hypothetical protein